MKYRQIFALITLSIVSNMAFANLQYDHSQVREFIKTNSCISCDLSGLPFAYYTKSSYSHCDIQGSNFTDVDLNPYVFSGCNFSDINGSNSHFDTDVENANFSNATLVAARFGSPMGANDDATNANFEHAILIDADFSNGNAPGANFEDANLTNANFATANLYAANFTGTNVSGVNFYQANLRNAIISAQQLATASSVCDAILPNGSIGKCSLSK